jgi:outer membrane protein assembly factor BamA
MKIIPLCILLLFICATGKTIAQVQPAYPEFRDELPLKLKEDSSSKLLVREITIKGNKKTRSYIILREILLKKGDSVIAGKLMELVTLSKNLVYNSNLFLEVDIQPILESAFELRLEVTVKERWYILPIPQFKLTDRNFNEWYKVYNADFNRVIYGAKFTHYNFSGRGDQLRVSLLSGYARSLSFSYAAPASNNALTEGYSIATSYTQNREIPIQTSQNNKLIE